ncbi:MAG TPA: biopolymer transporter ExbD [Kofleriaceae bacterium]|jgi:biopolymer transport protein ExbD
MAHALGTGGKGSVNLDINIVPFVDVMSCLTAFLLVTAAWIQTANLQNSPAGRAKGDYADKRDRLSVLIEPDSLVVSMIPGDAAAAVDRRQLRAADWDQLRATLRELHGSAEDRPRVEIGADSTRAHPIPYQALIAAMDTTVQAGFPDVGVVDPAQLGR